MNRFTSAVPVVLVFCAVTAASADEKPTSVAAPAATAVAAKTPATSTVPAAQTGKVQLASASTPSSGNPSVNRMVCLNMSLQCFAMKPNPDDAAAKAQTASLDLKAPDVRRVAPSIMLTEPDETVEEQQVEVQGTRPEVYVPGGIASLPWAVVHPTQAWRIFLPVPPGTAK